MSQSKESKFTLVQEIAESLQQILQYLPYKEGSFYCSFTLVFT